jgi:type IV pilus assembly protein PilB
LVKRNRTDLFGKILIEIGIIKEDCLNEALSIQNNGCESMPCGEILRNLGHITDEHIAQALSLQYKIAYLPVSQYDISPEITNILPLEFVVKHSLVPIEKQNNVLVIAAVNPLNKEAIKEAENISKCIIRIFITTPREIRITIQNHFSSPLLSNLLNDN